VRAVVDTNVIISALIAPRSLPGSVLRKWSEGRFDLLTCELQIEELRRVTRYPKIRAIVPGHLAGEVVNDLKDSAVWIDNLPTIDLCRDPMDNFLLALAQTGQADYLVTGDKVDLLSMEQHQKTKIVAVSYFAELF
jgi:uncharacterized protein